MSEQSTSVQSTQSSGKSQGAQAASPQQNAERTEATNVFKAKLQGTFGAKSEPASQQTEATGETDKGQAPAEKPAEKKPEAKQPEINPDLQKFIADKKLDLGELGDHPTIHKIVDMARNAEQAMQKAFRERDMEREAIKKKQLEQAADSVVNPQGASKEQELSPVQMVETNFSAAVENLLYLHGAKDEQELIEKYPGAYYRLKDLADRERSAALTKEVDWRLSKEKNERIQKERQEAIQKEFDNVKTVANQRIDEAKRLDPNIVEHMQKSGLMTMLDTIADLTKTPIEYFVASSEFFPTFVKMAKAMVEIDKLPERDEKVAKQVEADIKKAKAAEKVASGENLPDDHKAAQMYKFKSKLQQNAR